MSPVFRHGGLRLYLLKLLDEAPRHGYDVIRLLQDRFMGVYSPSPGTIYPRLARLEEEGLVTHETVDGKKIYKITDAGRAELNRRLDDLADLEDELAASVRDIAREISRDVRETVRSLRDELTFAVREASRTGRPGGPERDSAPADADSGDANGNDANGNGADRRDAASGDAAGRGKDHADGRAGAGRAGQAEAGDRTAGADRAEAGDPTARTHQAGAADQTASADRSAWATSTAESEPDHGQATGSSGRFEDARPGQAEPGSARPEDARPSDSGESTPESDDGTDDASRDRRRGDWRDWTDWAERGDWREWTDWAKRQPWGDWVGKQDWKERAKAGRTDWSERAQSGWAKSGWAQSGRQDWIRGAGPKDRKDRRDPGPDLISDLEHLAAAFAREIRGVAHHAEDAGEDAVGSLGRILGDALNRIRTEVFKPEDPPASPAPKDATPTDPAPPADTPTPSDPPSPPNAAHPS